MEGAPASGVPTREVPRFRIDPRAACHAVDSNGIGCPVEWTVQARPTLSIWCQSSARPATPVEIAPLTAPATRPPPTCSAWHFACDVDSAPSAGQPTTPDRTDTMRPNTSRFRTAFFALAAAILLIASKPARAEPYDLFARYTLRDDIDNKEHQFDVPLSPDTVLPRAGVDYVLSTIFLRMRTDDISNSTRNNFSRIELELVCDECKEKKDLVTVDPNFIDIKPGSKYSEKDILSPVQINSESAAQHITLLVRSKFSDAYLCAQEQEFRAAATTKKDGTATDVATLVSGNPDKKDCQKKVDADKRLTEAEKGAAKAKCEFTDSQIFAVSFLSKNPVLLDDAPREPLVYTFCKEVAKEIDWTRVVKRNDSGASKETEESYRERVKSNRRYQKEELSKKLKLFLKDRGFDNVRIGDDEGVEISAKHSFTIVKEMGSELTILESTNDQARPLGLIVDQDSQLELRAVSPQTFCTSATRDCATIISDAIQISLEGKDTKNNDVKKVLKLSPKGGSRWLVDLALADHLYKSVALRLHFKLGKKLIELHTSSFTVEDLGLVTSAPVISELITIFKTPGGNWKDASIKSSIPFSWAFNSTCKEGRHVAVTFPWMIGYNPRSAPRLADTFKVFPHASVIFPTDSAAGANPDACGDKLAGVGEPQLAFGVGVSLVNTFTLSWGISTVGQNYFLLGLSVPDLINLAK